MAEEELALRARASSPPVPPGLSVPRTHPSRSGEVRHPRLGHKTPRPFLPPKNRLGYSIFEWIVWYNGEQLHSSLGYMSPKEYEESLREYKAA